MQLDAAIHRGERFLHQVAKPVGPTVAESARLADEHRALVPLPDELEEIAEWPDARVPGIERFVPSVLAVLHLTEGVAVGADDVEDLGAAPELGVLESGEDVPGDERVGVRLDVGGLDEIGPVDRRNDVHHWVHGDHSGARIDLPNRANPGDRGFAQSQPQGVPPARFRAEWRDEAPLAPAVAKYVSSFIGVK